jgi:hypothetical protein
MFVFSVIADQGDITVAPGLVIWANDAGLYDAITGGMPVPDGGQVARWLADNSVDRADQATAGQRPLARFAAFPGRPGMIFAADQNLQQTPSSHLGAILIITGALVGGARSAMSRDTSQVTTAAAFTLEFEEYFAP